MDITIRIDPAEIDDFRNLSGDDHFERSILDAAAGHAEAAFRTALGDRLLKFQFTARGYLQWRDRFCDAEAKTVRTLKRQQVARVTGMRPVIDIPLDATEDFTVVQDPQVTSLPAFPAMTRSDPIRPPAIHVKTMKKWKRLTFSFLDVMLPVSAFPWSDINESNCDCPDCAIVPHLGGEVPTFVCAICGKRSWCSCMTGVVSILQNRQGYDTKGINDLVRKSNARDGACHLCRGVPVSSPGTADEGGVKGLMQRYYVYRHMAAIENGFDWKAGENSLRDRLKLPRIGEGWVSEVGLLRRIELMFPKEEVIHQGSPAWLGRQRFDVWMPERNVAVEYQGEQHYSPISRFGGATALEKTQQRDKTKRRLCWENSVKLIEIPYYENPTDEELYARITSS